MVEHGLREHGNRPMGRGAGVPRARDRAREAGAISFPMPTTCAAVRSRRTAPGEGIRRFPGRRCRAARFRRAHGIGAQVLLDLERYGEALDWARRAMAARPNPQMELVVAQALDKLDRPAEAVQLLDALLVREPGLAAAIEGRGVMLLRVDRPAEALTAFERCWSSRASRQHACRMSPWQCIVSGASTTPHSSRAARCCSIPTGATKHTTWPPFSSRCCARTRRW